MALPEALHLILHEDGTLAIADAQFIRHVTFTWAAGDPTDWSKTIVENTCHALDVTGGWVEAESDNDDGYSVSALVDLWHTFHEAEDGFMP